MEITEVRVRLVSDNHDRLKAYCSMTLDNEFVVRDIKIVESPAGYFVAMPTRKVSAHCRKCNAKNHLRARFCSNCGVLLTRHHLQRDSEGRKKFHADIVHPINDKCRRHIQERVMLAFRQELQRAGQPGYRPVDMDDLDDDAPQAAL